MRRLSLLAALVLSAACARGHALPGLLPLGTWGGADAALIVSADGVHVHLGCTKGDIAGRVPVDAAGAFTASGLHNVDAFPVDRGIVHPARYDGRLHDDDRLTLDVTLLDTDQHLGSAEVFLGREPRMRNCPICR
jgi:hypothetical protein